MVLALTQRLLRAQYRTRRPFERKTPAATWHLCARLALLPAANDSEG